jgi:hypothetical protein
MVRPARDVDSAIPYLRLCMGRPWSADRDFGRFKGLKVVNPLLTA